MYLSNYQRVYLHFVVFHHNRSGFYHKYNLHMIIVDEPLCN